LGGTLPHWNTNPDVLILFTDDVKNGVGKDRGHKQEDDGYGDGGS